MAALKLTDTQRVILAAAGARDSGLVLPLPNSLRVNRGTQAIVLKGLLSKDLITARTALADEEVWEHDEDGTRTTLVITSTGLEAIGITSTFCSTAEVPVGPIAKPSRKSKAGAGTSIAREIQPEITLSAQKGITTREEPAKDTKLGLLIAALRRKKGGTIAELIEVTGWQAHSIRGAISGALKKKFKLEVVSETAEGGGRVYRIGSQSE